jgi:uncharacterized protein YkwD
MAGVAGWPWIVDAARRGAQRDSSQQVRLSANPGICREPPDSATQADRSVCRSSSDHPMPLTPARIHPLGAVIAVACALGGIAQAAPAAGARSVGASRVARVAPCARTIRHPAARRTRRCRKHPASVRHPKGRKHPAPAGAPVVAPALDAGDCTAADRQPTAANVIAIESATLCLVNSERTNRGLVALRVDPLLQGVATAHSADMIARDYFAHTTPSGDTAAQRILDSGYVPAGAGYTIGENIAYGTGSLATPRSIVTAWMNSPGHRANILDASYRQTGLGALAKVPASLSHGQAGGIYTQDFGVHD